MAGATNITKVENERKTAADLRGYWAKAHRSITTKPSTIKRGCIKVARRNEVLATRFSIVRGFRRPNRKLRSKAATEIKESDTAGSSYPTAIVLRARVGLNVRKTATNNANFLNRVRVSSSTKNAHANA